ncbi:hypothetical protein CMUS01_12707 [Colletotrichum musicola]|uniref:Uncharacterized protein n=1 Tax=Colletotrichum musicola TaxID=2175873 RepID=A0A8H6JK44_9PEZI|nr:hypothetical protein CMUS01_12707 [Colletotrichum musicola]
MSLTPDTHHELAEDTWIKPLYKNNRALAEIDTQAGFDAARERIWDLVFGGWDTNTTISQAPNTRPRSATVGMVNPERSLAMPLHPRNASPARLSQQSRNTDERAPPVYKKIQPDFRGLNLWFPLCDENGMMFGTKFDHNIEYDKLPGITTGSTHGKCSQDWDAAERERIGCANTEWVVFSLRTRLYDSIKHSVDSNSPAVVGNSATSIDDNADLSKLQYINLCAEDIWPIYKEAIETYLAMGVPQGVIATVNNAIESTQALANINLDFTLLKVDATREYHDLGSLLAPGRRETAEEGKLRLPKRGSCTSPPDASATSIWVELLKYQCQEAMNDSEKKGLFDIELLTAVKQGTDRQQLAEWDASARAWLRIADMSKLIQQKQLLLIIGSLNHHVNSMPVLHDSVMKAWKEGLDDMEALLRGSPLLMSSGGIYLALTSWHLYPDLNVLDTATNIVRQKDALIPGSGIVTIGLQREGSSHRAGLHWSLPLAHLRYYGDPVLQSSTITRQGSRLSLEEFNMAILGCVLGGWNVRNQETHAAISVISKLNQTISEHLADQLGDNATWLQFRGAAADSYLKSKELQRNVFQQLLSLGRKYKSFLGTTTKSAHPIPAHPFSPGQQHL